jgi:ribosomal protein S18 acetylase RimI-like enzyme
MPEFTLRNADSFTVEELTEIYNHTRIDYIVPMPMNVARLNEYIHNYDLDLTKSVVAMADDKPIGLAMLGVRETHTWITRLGVIPGKRHLGAGEALMRYVIKKSWDLHAKYIVLEVILNNVPAYRLFRKLGFVESRDLLILRRPPGAPDDTKIPYSMSFVNTQDQVMGFLERRKSIPSWLDDSPSLLNAGNMHAVEVKLENGGSGWLVYQKTVFQLGRIVVQTEKGDPYQTGKALIHALHSNNPIQDTKTENIPKSDPHLQAFLDMGYLESFARIEMRLTP